MFKIPIISGSIRSGRNTPRLARLLARHLQQRDDVQCEVVELADLDLPMLQERLARLPEPPAALVRFGALIGAADAVVIATPEYNKGYPAALKNAIDALGNEWQRKPVGIAAHSTGAFGGAVVLQQLRAVLMGLGAVPIPATFNVPHITRAIDEEGVSLDATLEERAARFVAELVLYAGALRGIR